MSPQAAAALGFLLPTCWEIEVTCAAAMLIVALYAAYELLGPRPPPAGADDLSLARELDSTDKVSKHRRLRGVRQWGNFWAVTACAGERSPVLTLRALLVWLCLFCAPGLLLSTREAPRGRRRTW